MRVVCLIGTAPAVADCTIERIEPPGVAMTRPVRVKLREVAVYETATMVRGQFSVVDDLDVEDDGAELLHVVEKRLRELAGARGDNGIILDPLNRKPNGTRIVTGLTLNYPFKQFRGTAIWLGEAPRPVKYLGTID